MNIIWAVAGMNGARELRMRWTELDGPPVAPLKGADSGSRLVERGLKQDLDGEVRIEFAPAGVTCTIESLLEAPGRSDAFHMGSRG